MNGTEFQVVAVYPSGRRFAVRKPHDSYLSAEMHRDAAIRQCEPGESYRYEIDMTYNGTDGQRHWDGNVNPVGRLGYSADEVTGARMIAQVLAGFCAAAVTMAAVGAWTGALVLFARAHDNGQ